MAMVLDAVAVAVAVAEAAAAAAGGGSSSSSSRSSSSSSSSQAARVPCTIPTHCTRGIIYTIPSPRMGRLKLAAPSWVPGRAYLGPSLR